jgi:hypothetical protein
MYDACELMTCGGLEQLGYSVVVIVSLGGVGSSEATTSLVSCARPLSLLTGLVLVGEMERPWPLLWPLPDDAWGMLAIQPSATVTYR